MAEKITLETFKEIARNSKDTKEFIKKTREIKKVPKEVIDEFHSKYYEKGNTMEKAAQKFMDEFGNVKTKTNNKNQNKMAKEKEALEKKLEVAKKGLADLESSGKKGAIVIVQKRKIEKLEKEIAALGGEAPKKEAKKKAPTKKKATPKKATKKAAPKKATKKAAPTKKAATSTMVEGEAQVKALKSKFPKGTKVEFIDVRNKKTVKGSVISFAYSKQRNGQYRLNAFVEVAGKKKKVRAAKLTKQK
jgi:hypothetical protein